MVKLAVLMSGGKDSWYAAYLAKKHNNEIACLVTLNPERDDSWMFHVPNIDKVQDQAKATDIPLIILPTEGIKEQELTDLKQAINLAKQKYDIEGICAGAIASKYQKERVENICEELELKLVAPLWGMRPEQYMLSLILDKFKVVIVGVAAEGLDKSFLGKEIDRGMIKSFKKTKIHLAGEGGEYETFVLDCPLFNKKLEIWNSSTKMEEKNTGKLIIDDIQLLKK